MTAGFDVVVAGHVCLDLHPDLSSAGREVFANAFRPGRLIATGPVSYATGGPVANTGLTLNQLGIACRLVAKVGDDLFGRAIQQIVGSHGAGLAESFVVDPSASTSYSIIINYPGVDRIFLHYPGANDKFAACDVPFELLKQARLFHFGYPPIMRSTYLAGGAVLAEIFRRARDTGVTTSLDMAFPDPCSEAGQVDWRRILERVLPQADLFLPSVEETLFMLRRETHQALYRAAQGDDILPLITPELLSELSGELIAMGAKIVGLKLGYRGLYLRTGDQMAMSAMGRAAPSQPAAWAAKELWAPCFKVAVAGTTGSGDATIAGLLAALLRGLTLEQALTMAVAVGACNVEAMDALSGIQTWDETVRRVAAGWERQPLVLDAAGWQFDQTYGLWRGPCA